MPAATPSTDALANVRVRVAVEAADEHGGGVDEETLSDLLPEPGPELDDLLHEARPGVSSAFSREGRRVYLKPSTGYLDSTTERRARGRRYLAAAVRLVRSELSLSGGMVRCAGVTGSTAYGEPAAGDDCDVFAVTRAGGLWLFLAYTYVALRTRKWLGIRDEPSVWCFNYILDESIAAAEFAPPQGFLFAREALTVRMIRGADYYRGLLESAPWLRVEAPRLYARWGARAGSPSLGERPVSALMRGANLAVFLFVAAYLQAVGLARNHRLRSSGRAGECFRTVTRLTKLAVRSEKFERLTEKYAPASAVSSVP